MCRFLNSTRDTVTSTYLRWNELSPPSRTLQSLPPSRLQSLPPRQGCTVVAAVEADATERRRLQVWAWGLLWLAKGRALPQRSYMPLSSSLSLTALESKAPGSGSGPGLGWRARRRCIAGASFRHAFARGLSLANDEWQRERARARSLDARRRGGCLKQSLPQSHGPLLPQSHGPLAPQSHGPLAPQSHGPLAPQSHEPLAPSERPSPSAAFSAVSICRHASWWRSSGESVRSDACIHGGQGDAGDRAPGRGRAGSRASASRPRRASSPR